MSNSKTRRIGCAIVVFMVISTGAFAEGEWATSVDNIYNTNSGYAGIGTDSPQAGLHILHRDALRLERPGTRSGSWNFMISHYNEESTGSLFLDPSEETGDFVIRDSIHNTRFYVDTSSGNIGVGTNSPQATLEVNGNIRFTSSGKKLEYYGNSTHWAHILFYNSANGNLELENYWESGEANIVLRPDKDVLIPNGTLQAKEIKVTTSIAANDIKAENSIATKDIKITEAQWSDFVFEDSYKLPSLDHVENYIKENKHLPDVPSAEQIAQDGLSMAEMMAKQMQKIEELTLYVIELKKQNERLSEISEELKKDKTQVTKMSELEARIKAIEGK